MPQSISYYYLESTKRLCKASNLPGRTAEEEELTSLIHEEGGVSYSTWRESWTW